MMVTYYDYVLGFIPLVLLGLGGGLHAAGLPVQIALGVGGFFAIGLMGHALFVNAPIDRGRPQQPSDPVESTSSVSMAD